MCGIVGFITERRFPEYRDQLAAAVDALGHRGPDDQGLYLDEAAGLGLGHRRLSILDLSSAGHQPMSSDDRQVWITYNGEIYNYKAIRSSLLSYGYAFCSDTDTEVVLKAYQHWGIDCLKHLQGMFSLAIYDRRKGQLFLARDRIGIKPLYYAAIGPSFLFASELKALMAFKLYPRDLDPDAIPLFLHYQYIPTPRTIFKQTYKLPPGHLLIKRKEKLQIKSYWQLPDVAAADNSRHADEKTCLDKLDHLLSRAVSDRLISDVPLGALLSGGVDSSVVAALMQKASGTAIRTFSIGFKEGSYNEAPWAAKVADYLGTDHTELYVTPDEALGMIPQLPYIYDEPFADASAIPTHLVSKLTRSQVTVALSGDGGDEQFSGYVRYWSTASMSNWSRRVPKSIRAFFAHFLAMMPMALAEKWYRALRHYLPQKFYVANFRDKWEKLIDLIKETELQELYRVTICLWLREEVRLLVGHGFADSTYESVFRNTSGWPLLSRLMRVDQKTYLPDAMLTKVDRASMATSLEVRVPLLDHRVVSYTALLPDNLKYRNGVGKYLLKKLLARYLPPVLFERPKMGFGVPIDRWLRKELKPLLTDYLSPDRLKAEGLFNPQVVSEKIQEHLEGKINHQYRLWCLLMWEMWRERWLK